MTVPTGTAPSPARALDVDTPEGARPPWQAVVGWHAAFWVVVGLGLLSTWLGPTGGDRAGRTVQVALLVVLSCAYLLAAPHLGRGVITWQMWTYVVTAVVAVGVACWSDTSLSLLLFIAYPQMWIFAGRRTSTGVLLNAALTLSGLLGFVLAYGWSTSTLREVGPQMAVSLGFSVLLGVWISRIVQQSVERGQLIAELEATRSALAAAHHEQGVMAERERIAREIHDTLAQGFTSIVMLAQAATAARDPQRCQERLAMIEEVARDNLAEARALVGAFAPVDLAGSDVVHALTRLAARFGRGTGLDVVVEAADGAALRRDQEVVLLRVAQEALTNIRRHAQATTVTLRLCGSDERAELEIADDGVGFTAEGTRGGFGLAGMRARVAEIGGRVAVTSSPGSGTIIRVSLPAAGGDAPRGGLPERTRETTR
ncbi:MAG: sensor histidine kinase [Kineosporiaceae bacterium]